MAEKTKIINGKECKMVTVKIDSIPGVAEDDVWVGAPGFGTWQIKRDEDVIVPEIVASILNDSLEQKRKARKKQAEFINAGKGVAT